MLTTLLILSWLIFGTMAAFTLFYKNHQNQQILGVTLSAAHAQAPEIEVILSGYKRLCYLVFLLSAGLSLLLLLPVAAAYTEFFLLILVLVNIFFNWYAVHRYQRRLQTLKQEKGWVYQRSGIVTVDINVVKEKGKAGVSAVWSWLFLLLSFIPTLYLLFSPAARELYPVGFSLIGPFCQLNMIFLYYQMRNSHTPALSENTEINKACARTQERIRTQGATLSGLSMLVFWFLFNLSILYAGSGILIVLPVFVLIAALLSIAYWQQKKIRNAENYFFGPELHADSHLSEQEGGYKWGFYYNPSDPRIFVPKRIAGMGWTINIAHPVGKAVGFAILALILAALIPAFYGGAKDYVITESGSQITIDAAMYDLSIDKNQIVSVSALESLPRSARTNGYGGSSKSFGHFTVDGYGKCMLYVYSQGGSYIVLQLDGDNPGYVIVNGKTPADTEALYRSINAWLKEKEL
ncbi:DUF5808 domain-containing protein [Dehalobacter sp. DCM]|uniref:DUF5808 domain-containing protein n=1 Tax=Dehalobacter sp. DCM TaxID=2907827 RepID=UPI0030819946|nr:DUF5808 domain-containing protein [Dehalobacter sp. DCM]